MDLFTLCKNCGSKGWDDYPICTHKDAINCIEDSKDHDEEYHPPIVTLLKCPKGIWNRNSDGFPIHSSQKTLGDV